ncbi:uncharacterized protein BP01DRAFT_391228 [Aspergillus saccharolyticus JOP 1030-1]|uniref:Uncharacterized protein n=1 Tax=Aspergillus saccharolyticus JOP 1030-1 TaxID=1450539 RepID=A0A318ZE95_9EURO|nr:hypothetical protein BP01DRAFT_391228 [Aspergillus saccharolyticus JOP 1030-1]PYH45856.1 hypothetical protein BP01DRAFT_391228 [Aspergillus saccharolyticus JOP 1030-1]
MSYLSTRILDPPPGRIHWDNRILQPPKWLLTILPATTRHLLGTCYNHAYHSLRTQRYVELCFAQRYKALCPTVVKTISSSSDPSTSSSSSTTTTTATGPTATAATAATTTTAVISTTTATATATAPIPTATTTIPATPTPTTNPTATTLPQTNPPNPPARTTTPNNIPAQITHTQSIDRLFNWRRDYIPGDPTLAPTAKIPCCALRFHIDEAAYTAYATRYTALLDWYLAKVYQPYREAVRAVEECLVPGKGHDGGHGADGSNSSNAQPETAMPEMDRRQFKRWWEAVFVQEMMRWENRIPLLVVPSFEQVVGEVWEAVGDAVELEGEEISTVLAHSCGCIARETTVRCEHSDTDECPGVVMERCANTMSEPCELCRRLSEEPVEIARIPRDVHSSVNFELLGNTGPDAEPDA